MATSIGRRSAGRSPKSDSPVGVRPKFVAARDHGYVFEVPASIEPGLAAPEPIREMGRFRHEAVAIDPSSGVVYLTEDCDDGLLFRFLPKVADKLHQGGRLPALGFVDNSSDRKSVV